MVDTNFKNINIRKKMEKYGITQQALAKEIGVHFVTLNLWLNKELNEQQKVKIESGIEKLRGKTR